MTRKKSAGKPEAERGRKEMLYADDDELNITETASFLKVSITTLNNWCAEKPPRLTFFDYSPKIRRFRVGDLRAFKESRKRAPTQGPVSAA